MKPQARELECRPKQTNDSGNDNIKTLRMASHDPNGDQFPILKNRRIIKAALGQEVDTVPVWIMRQAGRYLPEFRQLRAEHSFFDMCETPKLACEATLMPLKRFNLDAAIIFSDILIIPQALGLEVEMKSGEGPKLPEPLKLGDDINKRLDNKVNIAQRLSYVYEAIRVTRHAIDGQCPLIGFSGAPWTLMCYMIEGGGSKTMSKAKRWLYEDPKKSCELLSILADKVTDHLVEQARHGAQLVQIFESNAEYLTRELFERFAYPYILKICREFKRRVAEMQLSDTVPIIFFAKGGHYTLDLIANDSDLIDVVSLDWTIDPELARAKTRQTLQGNLDPCALYASDEDLNVMAHTLVKKFGKQRYIANLGHGIYPDMDPEKVRVFVDAIHRFGRV